MSVRYGSDIDAWSWESYDYHWSWTNINPGLHMHTQTNDNLFRENVFPPTQDRQWAENRVRTNLRQWNITYRTGPLQSSVNQHQPFVHLREQHTLSSFSLTPDIRNNEKLHTGHGVLTSQIISQPASPLRAFTRRGHVSFFSLTPDMES